MRKTGLTIALRAGVFALCALAACSKGQQAAAPDRTQVMAYLMDHPDVIEAAANQYESKRHDQAMLAAGKAIAKNEDALERDPRDFVANPSGRITVVEFFDYRCPYCKAALPDLKALIEANKDVRFVFKEFPILPDANGLMGVSMRASRAAILAGRQGKYLQVHDAMMAAPTLDDAGIAKALKANGVDPVLVKASAADDKRIDDTRNLAVTIGATGTPTFVVGKTMVEGNRMDALSAAIAEARKSAKG